MAEALSDEEMADSMVKHYYTVIRDSPREFDEYYYDVSEDARHEKYGSLNATNSTEMMKTKMPSLNYDHMEVDFHSSDVQKSLNGGIDVLVTGYLTGKDNVSHAFSHSFFLAPREVAGGYYILNDMFRYMENNHHEGDQAPVNDLVPVQMAVPEVADVLHDSLHLRMAKAFVERYYAMLHESPGLVYLFYKDISQLCRPEADGSLSVTTSMHAIKAKILSLNYGNFMTKSIDAQVSLDGSINILVTGYLTGKDNVTKNFTQSFFLAAQEKDAYFILHDMFRYTENNHHEGDQAPITDLVPENNILKQMDVPGVSDILHDSLHLRMAKAFVERYYAMLHESAGLVYQFYKDISKLCRPEADGSLSVTTSMHAIKAKIVSLNYGDFMIKSIDTQVSLDGSINILVTGYLTGKDNVTKNFTQSFFLASQEKGAYFILHDMFRYTENNHHEGDQAPITDLVPENNILEQMAVPGVADILPDSLHLQIGKGFVEHYYAMLHKSPGLVYLFYKDISKLCRPEADGSLSVTTSMPAIKAKILSLNYGDFMTKSIDAQVSLDGSINILVTGYLTGKDNVTKNFTQSFFLAPQDEGGYFVLNDMFRYVENNTNYHTQKVEAEDREYEKQYIVVF